MTIDKLMELLHKADNKQLNILRIKELKDYTDEEIDIILSTNNKRAVITLIKNTDFRSQPKELQKEIIEIIGNSNGNSTALYYAVDVATDKTAINSGCIKEIIEILVKIENNDKISMISSIVTNRIATKHKDMLKMIQMIIDSPLNTEILTYAEMMIKNEFVYRTGNILEKVKSILNVQTEQDAQRIFSKQLEEGLKISLLQALEEKIIDEVDFWALLTENYEMALKLLLLESFPKHVLVEPTNPAFTEQEYNELINKYFLENITITEKLKNQELPSNIKVRRK